MLSENRNKGVHAIKAWIAVCLIYPVYPFYSAITPRAFTAPTQQNEVVVVRRERHNEFDDIDNESSSCCVSNPITSLNLSIYTSRRKFIIYSTAKVSGATGFAALTLTASAEDDHVDVWPHGQDNLNTITIPRQIPPFSTTRKYRNIVLSNGLKVLLVQDSMVLRSSVAISIDGAGQFAEPENIPGLAHLMEHIVLSSTRSSRMNIIKRETRILQSKWGAEQDNDNKSGEEDFEDWLSENDGEANAFTAPGFVCFHFNCPHEILPEGLERFSRLFSINEVKATIAQGVIPREISRVAAELDRTEDSSRAFYFLKRNFNPKHPFARFSAGSKTTLQTTPTEEGIDVASELLDFFRNRYLSSKATLVVVGRDDLSSLDRWISPFSNVMTQQSYHERQLKKPAYPEPMIGKQDASTGLMQAIILRSKDDIHVEENYQTLCIEWPLSLAYESNSRDRVITAHAVGFILTQIICRRGPGSLRLFLEKLNWAPDIGSKGVPKISFPVDVSGFQILRMEICLTLEGFSNRSAVVCAVFDSIRKVTEKPLQLDLIKQYLAAGLIHGYLLAPRPPDAITLAVDALRFGIGGEGTGSNEYNWYLMPSPDDEESTLRIRQVVTQTLETMSNESVPLVSIRASPKAVFAFSGGIVDQRITIPPIFSPWKVEPVTGARYLIESRANGAFSYFKSRAWLLSTFDGVELTGPYLNPLLPIRIRPPRPISEREGVDKGNRQSYVNEYSLTMEGRTSSSDRLLDDYSKNMSQWKLWVIQKNFRLPMPVRPPEPTVECAIVVQLLSSLPSTFTRTQLILSNLWLLSFDDEVLDLAELGAAAGFAYETSMNSAGLRLCFRGISQTLPSFVRRFCRRLIQHHVKLYDGSFKISEASRRSAVSDSNRSPKINRLLQLQMSDNAIPITEQEVASHGLFFLRCTTGGRLIVQGDIVPSEAYELLSELQFIFRDFGSAEGFSVQTEPSDLLYRPFWKPRDASLCLLPGISLISDACGRIPR